MTTLICTIFYFSTLYDSLFIILIKDWNIPNPYENNLVTF